MPEDKKVVPLKEAIQRHIENTDSEHAKRERRGGNVERKFKKIEPKPDAVKE